MKNKTFAGLVPVVIVLVSAVLLTAQQREEVVVVGSQKLLKFDFPIGRSAIGNDNICDFRILESRREVSTQRPAPR